MPIIRLNEMVSKEQIKDEQILNLIKQSINDINNKTRYHIDNDVDWGYGESTGTFGMTHYPKRQNGRCEITLNKQMVGEDDNAIKNVICHELCHYIDFKQKLQDNLVYWKDGTTLKYNLDVIRKLNKGDYSSHGKRWKKIASDVSKALNLNPPITTTNTFELHNKVGEYSKSKDKYQVKCTNCGHIWTYQKTVDFVVHPNKPGRTRDYAYYCPYCGAMGQFETNYNARNK